MLKKFLTTPRILWGRIRMWYHLAQPKYRQVFDAYITEMVYEAMHSRRGLDFVMMVGLSLSGKSWLIANHPELSRYWPLSTNRIHQWLDLTLPCMDDDKSTSGFAYWERQWMTKEIRRRILHACSSNQVSIVSDSGNHDRKRREKTLAEVTSFGYRSTIVWVQCGHEELHRRAVAADAGYLQEGLPATWVKLISDQANRFQPLKYNEADRLITFRSGVDDPLSIPL